MDPEGALAASASGARAGRVGEVEELLGRRDGVAGAYAAWSAVGDREEGEGPVKVLDTAWFHGFATTVTTSGDKGRVNGIR